MESSGRSDIRSDSKRAAVVTLLPSAADDGLQPAIDRALRRIDGELTRRAKKVMTLSPGARISLELLHPEYLGDLGQTAVRIARQDRVSTVDAVHVERAAQLLVAGGGPQYLATALNSFGGLFAGLGGAVILDFAVGNQAQPTWVTIFGIVLAVVGFVAMTVGVVAAVRKPT